MRLRYVWGRLPLDDVNGIDKSVHDLNKYNVSFTDGLELPFFADYVLGAQDAYHLYDGLELHLPIIYIDICLGPFLAAIKAW